MGKNNMSVETGAGVLITKYGAMALLGSAAALLGAGIMAVFRPPKSRKEMFLQGVVALGSSFLFGGTAVKVLAHITGWVDLAHDNIVDISQFTVMVYGLIGAFSWGLFGGIAYFRDKFEADPIQAIKDVKDL